ncbi:MAG TPA: outer membrane protein assembly factor BamE [Azospirillaceae bacterium]|nr:outer membrane protein assembly factor BamE [Azospirillaceae bacterium]
MPFKTSPLLLTAGLAALGLTACQPLVATRGNMADPQRLAQIQPGASSREQVQTVLGSPSATGTVDPNTWYYIGQVKEQTAFFRPEVVDQKIVRIRFDQAGTVAAVDELSPEQARAVEPVERVTPTAGRDLGFFEQLLGNLGRPARKKDDKKKKG